MTIMQQVFLTTLTVPTVMTRLQQQKLGQRSYVTCAFYGTVEKRGSRTYLLYCASHRVS